MKPVSSETTAAWLSGDYTGERRAMARVTIQKMHVFLRNYSFPDAKTGERRHGKFASMPFAQTYTPLELPNLKSLSYTRGSRMDVATCELTFYNTAPLPLGQPVLNPAEFGQPGYYTGTRGTTDFSEDWPGHVTNGWQRLLVPDRILRTYEGYGFNPDVGPELDEHMYPSGVWLIDEVELTHQGALTVRARDFGRALLDQISFPPVVPWSEYPQIWDRYHQVPDPDAAKLVLDRDWFRPRYEHDSNVDYVGRGFNDGPYPYISANGKVYGHHGRHAFDGSMKSYFLSVGNIATWSSAYEFVQGTFSRRSVGAVRVKVHGGPYICYVSVQNSNGWRGKKKIPYRSRVVDTHADIRFVKKVRIPRNGHVTVNLPQVYDGCRRVRVTLSHLWNSGLGSRYKYRGAIADVQVAKDTMKKERPVPKKWVGNYADYCVDQDTEILTRRGWLRYDEVHEGDETLGINPATGCSEWQVIESLYRRHRSREMVLMQGTTHSSLTTPDHRWLIRNHRDEWEWRTTETLKTGHKIPLTAPRADQPLTPAHKDALVELAAWWWTEGSSRGEISQSERVNPQYTERIRACLRSLYGEPGPMRRSSRIHPRTVEAARVLRQAGRSLGETARQAGVARHTIRAWEQRGWPGWSMWNERCRDDGLVLFKLSQQIVIDLVALVPREQDEVDGLVPTMDFLTSLTGAQLDHFIDTAIDGDGWRTASGVVGFSQACEKSAKAFEAACALAGRATSTRRDDSRRCLYSVTVLRRDQILPVNASRSSSFEIRRVPYEGVVWCPTIRHHNWVARRNGKVYVTGNTDIVKWILAWSGYFWPGGANAFLTYSNGERDTWLPEPTDPVLGNTGRVWGDLELTGTNGPATLTADIFDKRPLFEGLAYIRDIVGFVFFTDETGGAIWRSPNIWSVGNYVSPTPWGGPSPGRTSEVVVVDERTTLLELTAATSSRNVRERIVVANYGGKVAAVTAGYNPYRSGLRRVAAFTDQHFETNEECQVMADLIAVRQMFGHRRDRITIAANPAIQVDDQVRILERVTEEGYLHYVSEISSSWDLESGRWTYTLSTFWLGETPFETWAFNPYDLSAETQAYLEALGKIASP